MQIHLPLFSSSLTFHPVWDFHFFLFCFVSSFAIRRWNVWRCRQHVNDVFFKQNLIKHQFRRVHIRMSLKLASSWLVGMSSKVAWHRKHEKEATLIAHKSIQCRDPTKSSRVRQHANLEATKNHDSSTSLWISHDKSFNYSNDFLSLSARPSSERW